jgi:hypothetical protein
MGIQSIFCLQSLARPGTLIKRLLLMLINVTVLATSRTMLPPAPSVLQGGSSDGSDASVKTHVAAFAALGMIGEAVVLSHLGTFMPRIHEASGGRYGARLFATYAVVLGIAEFATLRSAR